MTVQVSKILRFLVFNTRKQSGNGIITIKVIPISRSSSVHAWELWDYAL